MKVFPPSSRENAKSARYGIVVSRFNEEVTEKLLANCLSTLQKAGVPKSHIDWVSVPGAYEIPWVAQELALCGRYDVVVCLGAVLKGETSQNEHIARSVIESLQSIILKTRVPCVLGVITPRTWKQAVARTKGENDRGQESALAALDLAELKLGGCIGRTR
ncbi:MAG: 6,7-dimethyl-8-ribityllumazine synthase [Elusimicrobiota bacterium]|jgi:6,7-dimethyl-8-ribityllumazine synthase